MDRRSLLVAAAALAGSAAGCTGLPGSGDEAGARAPRAALRARTVTDADIARRFDRRIPAGDDRTALFEAALDPGSVTRERQRPRLREGTLVHEGTRYRVSITVEDRRPATVYPIVLENLSYDGVTASPDADRVRFEELPAVDRRVLRENGLADGDVLGIGTQLVYADAERERSALVPPTETVIVWGPDRKGLFESRHERRDTTLVTRRYTAERLEPAAAYGRRLRERHARELSLPDAEAEVLRTAVGTEAYTVPPGGTPAAPFRSLAERFRELPDVHEATEGSDADGTDATGERSGTYLVRFDGAVLLVSLRLRPPDGVTTTNPGG